MGRRSLFDVIVSILGIAQIRAIFEDDGNNCFDIQLFKTWVRGDASCSATILINFTGIPSGPEEQSERKVFISVKTSR